MFNGSYGQEEIMAFLVVAETTIIAVAEVFGFALELRDFI